MSKSKANMPNKKGHRTRRRTPKKGSPMGLNQCSDCPEVGHSKAEHSEVEHSEANHFKLEAKRVSPVPSRGHQKTAQRWHLTEKFQIKDVLTFIKSK